MNSHLSRRPVTRPLQPPFETHRAGVSFQSALHRIGFTWPHSLLRAGELLPRLSTLTRLSAGGISLLHFPWGHPRRPLAVILPCGARTFLISKTYAITRCSYYKYYKLNSLSCQLSKSVIYYCGILIFWEKKYDFNKRCNRTIRRSGVIQTR